MCDDIGISDLVKPYIAPVLEHNFGFGQKPSKAKVAEVYGGSQQYWLNLSDNDNNCITLLLPNGKQQYLTWSFAFNLENLYEPPDVVSDDTFFDNLQLPEVKQNVPSLQTWDPTVQACFLNLVLEFLQLYKMKQLELVNQLGQFSLPIEFMLLPPRQCKSDFFAYPSERASTLVAVVSVDLSLEGLPLSPTPPSCVAELTVTYKPPGVAAVSLSLWKELENLIGDSKIPPPSSELSLSNYISVVQIHLHDRISQFTQSITGRQELLCALLALVGPAVLDYDSELFTRLSFLLESEDQQALCLVDVAETFPKKGVHLTVSQVTSRNRNPRKIDQVKFNYNEKWSAEITARKIFAAFQRDLFGITEKSASNERARNRQDPVKEDAAKQSTSAGADLEYPRTRGSPGHARRSEEREIYSDRIPEAMQSESSSETTFYQSSPEFSASHSAEKEDPAVIFSIPVENPANTYWNTGGMSYSKVASQEKPRGVESGRGGSSAGAWGPRVDDGMHASKTKEFNDSIGPKHEQKLGWKDKARQQSDEAYRSSGAASSGRSSFGAPSSSTSGQRGSPEKEHRSKQSSSVLFGNMERGGK